MSIERAAELMNTVDPAGALHGVVSTGDMEDATLQTLAGESALTADELELLTLLQAMSFADRDAMWAALMPTDED